MDASLVARAAPLVTEANGSTGSHYGSGKTVGVDGDRDLAGLLKLVRRSARFASHGTGRRDPALTYSLGRAWLLPKDGSALSDAGDAAALDANAKLLRTGSVGGLSEAERYDCVEAVAIAAAHCGDVTLAQACLRHLQVHLGFTSVTDSTRLRRLALLVREAGVGLKADGAAGDLARIDADLATALQVDASDFLVARRRAVIRKQLENMRGADLTKEAKKADGVTSTSILRKIVDFQGVDAETWLELADAMVGGQGSSHCFAEAAAFCVEEAIAGATSSWQLFSQHGETLYAAAIQSASVPGLVAARKSFAHAIQLLIWGAEGEIGTAESSGAPPLLSSIRPVYGLLQAAQRISTLWSSTRERDEDSGTRAENAEIYAWARKLVLRHYEGDALQQQVFAAAYPAEIDHES